MKNIIRLITDTTIYREVSTWSSIRLLSTFFFLYAIVGVANTVAYFQINKPEWEQKGLQTWQQLASSWNKDLVIRYANNELSATPSATITIEYPDGMPETAGLPSHFVYLDTSTSNRPTQNQSLITITKTELGTFESPERYHWISLSEVFDVSEITFDYNFIQSQTPNVEKLLVASLTLLGAAVFVGNALFLPVLRLGIAALFTFLTPNIFAMFGNSKNWKVAWKVGCILLPLAELAQLLLTTLTQPNPLQVFWIIWLGLIVLVNISNPQKM